MQHNTQVPVWKQNNRQHASFHHEVVTDVKQMPIWPIIIIIISYIIMNLMAVEKSECAFLWGFFRTLWYTKSRVNKVWHWVIRIPSPQHPVRSVIRSSIQSYVRFDAEMPGRLCLSVKCNLVQGINHEWLLVLLLLICILIAGKHLISCWSAFWPVTAWRWSPRTST